MQYCSLQYWTLLLSPVTSTTGYCFALAPSLHSFWSYFSTHLQQHTGHLLTWGVPLSVSYHFAFSYCSWGSQGRNSEVICHSLLQWTTFCQTSPPELTHWKRLWCWEGLGQEEKGTIEDEMAGWHHWLDGHESEWTLGVGDEQGGLACCNSWGRKESDTTEWLNWTELNFQDGGAPCSQLAAKWLVDFLEQWCYIGGSVLISVADKLDIQRQQ